MNKTMNKIIYDKFGKDCGNIILNYKKDLDKYEICLDNYKKMFSMLFEETYLWNSKGYNYNNEKAFRVYDILTITQFLYFLKYYIVEEEKEILSFFKFRITIRDNYNNFNKDYHLTNTKYKFKDFIKLDYYNWLEIKTIRKTHNNELTFNLHDNYIKKQKLYKKVCSTIYFWCKKKINRMK